MKHVLDSLMAIVALIVFAGCGKPPAPAPTPEAARPETTPPPESTPAATPAFQGDAEKQLSLFCWSEYVPQEIVESFARETGITVSVENYASNEEMLAKLLAGGGSYDLIQPSEYVVEGLIREDLLQPLDHALIPNLKNVAPEFLNMSFDPGNKYSIPYMAGTVGIVVNTELVKDEIKGYQDVFQEKYKGNIVVLDDAREIVSWGLETLDLPINEPTSETLEKVRPLLAKWLPFVKVFDSDSPKTSLLNGDVALGVVYGGEGAKLLEEDKKFKWVVPVEGSHLFVDSLVVPKAARHPRNAQLFMNFILRPEISVKISNAFPYLNPNAAARELLSPAQRSNPASYPLADDMARMQIFKDIGDQATVIDELVTSLKAR